MRIKLEGSQEELERLRADLEKKFPADSLRFGEPSEPQPAFGARRSLGEAALLTLFLTVLVTKLAQEVGEDVYGYIKQKYITIRAERVPAEDAESHG